MNIAVKTLSKRLPEVMEALDKNERVVLSHEGKELALLQPVSGIEDELQRLMADPGFGMWADREDMADPSAWMREKRRHRRERLFGRWFDSRRPICVSLQAPVLRGFACFPGIKDWGILGSDMLPLYSLERCPCRNQLGPQE